MGGQNETIIWPEEATVMIKRVLVAGDTAKDVQCKLFKQGPYWCRNLNKTIDAILNKKRKLTTTTITPLKTVRKKLFITPPLSKDDNQKCVDKVCDSKAEWAGSGPPKSSWFRGELYNVNKRGKRGVQVMYLL